AIRECELKAAQFHIVAVNLSLGCACAFDDATLATLEDRIARAHRISDVSIVASAGNQSRAIGMPAAAAGVFSVGAGTQAGQLCSYSNRGSDLDVVAPGCDLDGASPSSGAPFVDWIGGTSPAAAIASSALAV